MEYIPYKTKSGLDQFKPHATPDEIEDGTLGFCLACGNEACGVEPDARRYQFESCGAPKVYGLEELMMMGLLSIND